MYLSTAGTCHPHLYLLNWAHKTTFPWQKHQPIVQWQTIGELDLLPQIGIVTNVLFISMSWTFCIWKSSPPSLSPWECLRGKSLLGSPKDFGHTKGREGVKCSCFFHCCSEYLHQVCFAAIQVILCYNLLLLPLCCPPPIWRNNFGHAFCYLICKYHVRVLNSSFDLIL